MLKEKLIARLIAERKRLDIQWKECIKEAHQGKMHREKIVDLMNRYNDIDVKLLSEKCDFKFLSMKEKDE